MINLYDMEELIKWYERHDDGSEQGIVSVFPNMIKDMRKMLDELRQLREGFVRPDGWPVRYHQ